MDLGILADEPGSKMQNLGCTISRSPVPSIPTLSFLAACRLGSFSGPKTVQLP